MSPTQRNNSILADVPGPVLKPRKSEQSRIKILEAALDFLWTYPFRDLTVSELMSKIGASRSAFYQYFDDLYDLIETLLHGLETAIFQVATPWLHGDGDPLPLLKQSLTGLVQICYNVVPSSEPFRMQPSAMNDSNANGRNFLPNLMMRSPCELRIISRKDSSGRSRPVLSRLP